MEWSVIRPIIAASIAAVVSTRAYFKKSLNLSGGLAGFAVMTVHFDAGWRFGAMLLAFFYTSSYLTKRGAERKRSFDPEYKEGGQRNWIQVFSNSLGGSILAMTVCMITDAEDRCLDSKDSTLVTALIGGIIGHYCCCNGDTWSSELGVLSESTPRLITNFKPVRKGTNGGVTKEGFLAAAAGGTVIGVTFVLVGLFTATCSPEVAMKQWLVIPISALAGLCGSLIDSFLGATLQFTGYCNVRKKIVGKPGPTVKKISGLDILDNNAVNFVSILVTTFLTGFACKFIF